MKKELYYVTSNSGKFAEVAAYCSIHAPDIDLKQFSADIPEIQTLDQMAIAIDKAKKSWDLLQKPLIIDDAGIYFDKYYKFPGTLSKFVSQGLGFEGLKRLIDEGDPATFLLYFVYVDGPDATHVFEGQCKGTLTKHEHFDADEHLPYDAFFIPDGATIRYADMRHDFAQHAGYFYRVRALKQFLAWFNHDKK